MKLESDGTCQQIVEKRETVPMRCHFDSRCNRAVDVLKCL
jgi:hypothetical protein